MAIDWKQQKALVTGGAGGIGRATVKRLLALGAKVAVWDFNQESLDEFARECSDAGHIIHPEICDITDADAVSSALQRSVAAMGGLSILVNNAGYVAPGYFEDRDFEVWSRTMEVNVEALMRLSYLALPHLKAEHRSSMINISSAAGVLGTAGLTAYSAAKWAVWGFSESLRQEMHVLGVKNLHIGTIHPVYLKTGMFEGSRVSGLGGLIVPGVKSHDHVARAIVRSIATKRNRRMLPRTVALAIFFRAILPDRWFQSFLRILNIHHSMDGFQGKGQSVG
jgi:all-trans-retinol dehydrogenase (NAD+)